MLGWTTPVGATVLVRGFHNTPVTGYRVQVRDEERDGGEYRDWLSVSGPTTASATVTGLHPGVRYSVRILAWNLAGSTPSSPINITTNASGKRLSETWCISKISSVVLATC